MQIRLATSHDLPSVMSLVTKIVPLMRATGNLQWNTDYPNLEVFTRDLELNQLWLAEIDGDLAGFAAITEDQDHGYKQVGWDIEERAIVVHRLAVDSTFRGKGIAAAFMQKAEEVARERNLLILRVDTSAENAATQRLFPKLGYVYAGEITLAFRPGLRIFCYEKRLPVPYGAPANP
jgi:GNAT superfamily N-acetyltransferase